MKNVQSIAAVTESTGAGWSIRPSHQDDMEEVRGLLRAASLPVDGIEDHFDEAFIVAEGDGQVVGSVGVETYGRYGLLRSLAVATAWQGRQIGHTLVDDRLDWARTHGIVSLFLLTLDPAYFERFGFQPVRRDSVPPDIRNSHEFTTLCPDTAVVMALPVAYTDDDLRRTVRDKYASIAKTAKAEDKDDDSSCCGTDCCGSDKNAVTTDLYTNAELADVPKEAADVSLGCGNPTALAELAAGETVLDLGSGGGIDVILSARRVGPTGKAYGLDMTDEMLEIARENQKKAGVDNAEFLKGEIENIPLPDGSADVIVSNCVINLSTDKRQAIAEAFRVLRPGGRLAVSDIVTRGELPESVRRDAELWAGCLAGSLEEGEYRSLLEEAGFENVEVEPTRVYSDEDIDIRSKERDVGSPISGKFMSAFIRATKPAQDDLL